MKKSTTLLLFIGLVQFTAFSQCVNYKDCLEKANGKIEYLDKAIKFAKKEKMNASEAYLQRGKLYLEKASWREVSKESKAAKSDLEMVLELNPNEIQAIEPLIKVYLIPRDYKGALKFFNSFIKSNEVNPVAYYGRGLCHELFKYPTNAGMDFIQANALLSNSTIQDSLTKGMIGYRAIVATKRKAGGGVYNADDLVVLSLLKNSVNPVLLGELALAYHDNEDFTKANAFAEKAISMEPHDLAHHFNSGGHFVLALPKVKNKEYFSSTGKMRIAHDNRPFKHPAISYYAALSSHGYYSSEKGSSLWSQNEPRIKKLYQEAIDLSPGTKYEEIKEYAAINLDRINNPKQPEKSKEEKAKDFKNFLINFPEMPQEYTLDYRTIGGRDISSLAQTKEYFRSSKEVYSLGMVCNGSEGYVFLVMQRVSFGNQRENVTFDLIYTDPLGKIKGFQEVCRSEKHQGAFIKFGVFTYTRLGNGYSFLSITKKGEDGEKKYNTVKGTCK